MGSDRGAPTAITAFPLQVPLFDSASALLLRSDQSRRVQRILLLLASSATIAWQSGIPYRQWWKMATMRDFSSWCVFNLWPEAQFCMFWSLTRVHQTRDFNMRNLTG